MTLAAKGHLYHPQQSQKYWSILTLRRMFQKRPRLEEKFAEVIVAGRDFPTDKVHGPATIFRETMQKLQWTIDDRLMVTRKRGGSTHLVHGDDRIF